MALILSPSLRFNLSNPKPHKNPISNHNFNLLNPSILSSITTPFLASKPSPSLQNPPLKTLIPTSRNLIRAFSSLRFLEVDDDIESSPWEGAVIYKRDPSVSHLEYCTTLEKLGLEKLSSEFSRSRASDLGLRVTNAVKDYLLGTPVQISVDVTRKKKKLTLDGILRTVISLACNRCAEPATECIYSNFTLLLTEEPVEEPDRIFMGTIFGEDDEDSIDLDDQLYFPAEEKEIDISKNIRDMIHVEITLNAICDPRCKGLCLKCGMNLNKSNCTCSKQDVKGKDMAVSET